MFEFTLQTKPIPPIFEQEMVWDLLVIGAGPAGLNAGLYAQRKGLKVGVLTKEIGGQLHNTSTVDNYLGIPMLEGKDMSDVFLHHVEQLDVPIHPDARVTHFEKQGPLFFLSLENGTVLKSKTVLLATGGKPRQLNIPGENEYANKGVSYCTTCDAPFFKGKHVVVAGGGNSAAESVIDLAAWASHITVVHRSQWRADKVILDKFKDIPNLTIHLETQLLEVQGENGIMTGVLVEDKQTKEKRTIAADGLFIEIGVIPNSSLIKDLVQVNEREEIIVDEMMMTSLPGLFAAGDVTNQPFKQIVIAVADGAKAALAVQQYIIHHT
jgi:alkyl hydroperoxide reductase subunit F